MLTLQRTSYLASVVILATLSSIPSTAAQSPQIVLDAGYGYTYVGCYAELTSARALGPEAELFGYDNSDMTVETCAQYCQGFPYFGVEFGNECYCGSTVNNQSRPVTTESGRRCDNPQYACSGDPSEMCGGFQAYALYAQPGITSTAAVPSSTGYVYVVDSVIVPEVQVSPSESYFYYGCWIDPGQGQRALTGQEARYGASSVGRCAEFCTGYTYFGVENGGEYKSSHTVELRSLLTRNTLLR